MYQALTSVTPPQLESYVLDTAVTGLSLIPADRNLTGAEVEFVDLPNRESSSGLYSRRPVIGSTTCSSTLRRRSDC